MDPAQCRERMTRLISEESSGLVQLGELLEHEHGLLAAGDVVSLEAAINERQRCVGRISRIDDERRAMCRALNLSLDAAWKSCCAGVIRRALWRLAGPSALQQRSGAGCSMTVMARW